MTKPIKIPRDLKPGDVIVLNGGTKDKVLGYDQYGDLVTKCHCVYGPEDRLNGYVIGSAMHIAVTGIIRKTSKPTKPAKPKRDRDAEWLREWGHSFHLINEQAKRMEKQS